MPHHLGRAVSPQCSTCVLMSKTQVLTSTRIPLVVSTQFSLGKVSHRWSKVAMLSLKQKHFQSLKTVFLL